MVSLGRCQLAVTVATSMLAAQGDTRNTTAPRNRYGATSTRAHITDMATAQSTLGKLWPYRRVPCGSSTGRCMEARMSRVVTTDPTITAAAVNPRNGLRRTSPSTSTTTTAAAVVGTVIRSNRSVARTPAVPSTVSSAALRTASSNRCPAGVQTASRYTATSRHAQAPPVNRARRQTVPGNRFPSVIIVSLVYFPGFAEEETTAPDSGRVRVRNPSDADPGHPLCVESAAGDCWAGGKSRDARGPTPPPPRLSSRPRRWAAKPGGGSAGGAGGPP